jgi:hypothetical protein
MGIEDYTTKKTKEGLVAIRCQRQNYYNKGCLLTPTFLKKAGLTQSVKPAFFLSTEQKRVTAVARNICVPTSRRVWVTFGTSLYFL